MVSPYDFIVNHPPLVRRLVKKVTVYEDKFTLEFKSGLAVNVTE